MTRGQTPCHVLASERTNMNIILTGMPASGKSTVGVILAKVLGYDFVDTDLLIQRSANARLEKIIAERGVEAFLDLESSVCRSLSAENTVIATGGSVVYREASMLHFKELGTIVYLKVGMDALKARLFDMKERGVALKEGQSLEDLFLERTCLYERYADLTVDESSLGLEDTVKLVRDGLQKI